MSEKNTRSSNKSVYKGKKSGGKPESKRNGFKKKPKNNNRKQKPSLGMHFNNIEKVGKTFMYHNLTKSKCFNSNFSQSNFDFACFRGAHFKSCFFNEATFNGTEFVGSNLKDSKFIDAGFENTVFEGAKLEGADFMGATFKNVIFVGCKFEGVKNLDLKNEEIRVYDDMPQVEMTDELANVLEKVMKNKFVKSSRVLDTREGKINHLSVLVLKEAFEEETLIKGLKEIENHIDRDFYTLSFISKLIKKLEKEGVI